MILVKVEAGRCAVCAPSCLFGRLGEVSGRIRQDSDTTGKVWLLVGARKAVEERDSVWLMLIDPISD
jgi:hypothetical protein